MKSFGEFASGDILPIFPLPDVVLFPEGILPLHIFEPRYKEMVVDSLTGEKLICITLLKDGWQKNYYDSPVVYRVGCVGKIIRGEKLKDGKYDIVLKGLQRVKIEEIKSVELYRKAKMTIVEDKETEDGDKELEMVLDNLYFKSTLRDDELEEIRKAGLSKLMNMVSFILPLHVTEKQQLLEELNVIKRARKLIEFVKTGYITTLMGANWRRQIPKESIN